MTGRHATTIDPRLFGWLAMSRGLRAAPRGRAVRRGSSPASRTAAGRSWSHDDRSSRSPAFVGKRLHDASTIYRKLSVVKSSPDRDPPIERASIASGARNEEQEPHDGRRGPAHAGPALREHDPRAFDGCRPAGELWPPRHAHGPGAGRLRPLHAGHAALARSARLAGARPLRAVVRARVDAALLDPAPRRLRARPRADQALPPDRLAVRRPPRVRPRPGRR